MSTSSYPKKVWVLLVFGAAALALGLATLFLNVTEQETRLSSTVALPVGSPEFAAAAEAIVGSPRQPLDGDLQVFDDGSAFLADLLSEIGHAQRSVTMTDYIFRSGDLSEATIKALTEAALRGVQVRLLIDGEGAAHAPSEMVDALQRAGGKVATFRPRTPRYLTRVHRRNHMRAMVVDGAVGYVGGLAFDDGWLGDGVGEEKWRDLMFKGRGRFARVVQEQFDALWRPTSGEILSGPAFFPTTGTDSAGASTAPATWSAGDSTATTLRGIDSAQRDSARADSGNDDPGNDDPGNADPDKAAVLAGAAPIAAHDASTTSAAASVSGAWFVGLFHHPQPDIATDLQDLVWMSIAGAHDRLSIATPYMTPDSDLREAIMGAARRGVRVEVVMPGPYTDAKLIQAATRAYYGELLASGVRIFEYQAGRFHQKTLTADGHWAIVGSANMDNRSATLNVENVFGVEGTGLAGAVDHEMEIAKSRSVEITTQSWHPNPFERLYFNFARIFAKQY